MEWDTKKVEEGARGLIPDGTYAAVVKGAKDKTDKKGGGYFDMELEVYDDGGKRLGKVWDKISPNWFQHKFKHFFVSAGAVKLYEAGGATVSDIEGMNVGIILTSEEQDGYPPKNVVFDYTAADGATSKPVAKGTDDDDLPF